MAMDLLSKLGEHAVTVERILVNALDATDSSGKATFEMKSRLLEAMRYATLDQGKRFRPFLTLETATLFNVGLHNAAKAAAAVEMIHCYSLIHDDLPAMDDDDMRRGRPTTHIAFDEATAILAGDALLTSAFELLAEPMPGIDTNVQLQLIHRLASASGVNGMAGGQMMDLLAEGSTLDRKQIDLIQELKTGALIQCSIEFGALLGNATTVQHHALIGYGHFLGRAFQLADDLLDVEGEEAEMGKALGKDEAAGKATLVSILGLEAARKLLDDLESQAIEKLNIFGTEADTLRAAAKFVSQRRN